MTENPSQAAAENLKAIRSLVERATVYRSLSGPVALIGGVLSSIVSLWHLGSPPSWTPFLLSWMGVLLVLSILNGLLLHREAGRRGEHFFSAGMRHALQAMLPPLVAGFVLSVTLGWGIPAVAARCWVLAYGLALLAAGAFAPRSMRVLGYAFFLGGALLFLCPYLLPEAPYIMLATFSLLHLAYGIGIKLRPSQA
jgi:hypothetical protein